MLRTEETMSEIRHHDDCDCDQCALPRANKPPASLGRFTWRLALVWAGFRMVADMIGKTVYAGLNLILYLLQIALYALVVTGAAAAFYWTATAAGWKPPDWF